MLNKKGKPYTIGGLLGSTDAYIEAFKEALKAGTLEESDFDELAQLAILNRKIAAGRVIHREMLLVKLLKDLSTAEGEDLKYQQGLAAHIAETHQADKERVEAWMEENCPK